MYIAFFLGFAICGGESVYCLKGYEVQAGSWNIIDIINLQVRGARRDAQCREHQHVTGVV